MNNDEQTKGLDIPELAYLDPDKKVKRSWQSWLCGSPVFLISILLHILFIALALFFVVQKIKSTHKQKFTEVAVQPQVRVQEQKVHLAQMSAAQTSPSVDLRIVTPDVSSVNLPSVTLPSDQVGTGLMGGAKLGSGGVGSGVGGGEPISVDVSTVTLSAFGSATGHGLEGRFYDFTRTQQLGVVKPEPFSEIIHNFIANNWKPSQKNPCYAAPTKIYTNYLIVPLIKDEEAGKAFECPESSRAFWMVHYHANIQSEEGGSYCFYGFGDNILIVKINDKIVLEGSDLQYLKMPFQKMGMESIFPGGKKPLFKGEKFQLEGGTPASIDILIGDEGGVTTSGLFVKKGEGPITFGKNFTPEIPLFTVAPFSEADKKRLQTFLPPICLTHDTEFTNISETPQ